MKHFILAALTACICMSAIPASVVINDNNCQSFSLVQSGSTYTFSCGGSAPTPPTNPTPTPPTAVGSCGNLKVNGVDAQANYDRPGLSYTTKDMMKGDAYVLSFTTGPASAGIQMIILAEYAGAVINRFLNISTTPCDFTVPEGFNQVGTTTRKYFTVGTPYSSFQVLEPNTRYYVNIKNEDVVSDPGVDTCFSGQACGFVMTFYR